MTSPSGAAAVEQRAQGARPAAVLAESFDGLGVSFKGPQGTAILRNPSDNTIAVGPNHIFQIVNTRMAIFTKKGTQFSGLAVVYGPVATNTVFKGFGGACESINNGDAVVRYDQLADRWLIVMPTFRRGRCADQPQPAKGRRTRSGECSGTRVSPEVPLRYLFRRRALRRIAATAGRSARWTVGPSRCVMQSAPVLIH
jgi:hypothetical protein